MNKLLPALTFFLFTASVALAQNEPYEESVDNASSQRLVVAAINLMPTHANVPNPVQSSANIAISGIGPSSNMAQPGDYGYSAMSDLRQLNF